MQKIARATALNGILSRQYIGWRFPSPISVNFQLGDQEGIECLVRGVERFQQPDPSVHPHAVLGELTHEQWLQFHLWHCEHHLSFLIQNAV
jgi:hypothetical protein